MAFNEIEQRGTEDFPFAFFHVDENNPRYTMVAHWHSEIELLRILKGEFHITLNKKRLYAKKGDIIFINSETVHQGIPHDCVYECIVFHPEFLYKEIFDCKSFIKNIIDSECIIKDFFSVEDTEIYNSANNIFNAMLSENITRKFRVISAFYDFFAIVLKNSLYTQNIKSNTIFDNKKITTLKKILSYLRNNYDKPVTLEMIAGSVDKSPRYIGCFFKEMTGKTPIEYLNEYRIEKASHKLRSTDMTVTDIAFACGFSDLSYFIKMFKKSTGISPGKYRNS